MTQTSYQIVPVSPVAVGGLLWRRGGKLRVSVIVKATFAFGTATNGTMSLIEPSPIRTAEIHHGNSPARSIRESIDLVPPLAHAEVLFVGHAHAPDGEPATSMRVRLAVVRNQWPLVDKTLEVRGDRTALGGDPRPFTRMHLSYERAFGGAGSVDNPLGQGFGKSADRALPNVIYPDPHNEAPASFGPISHYWPSRKRLLHGKSRRIFDEHIVELPDDFDLDYFQSAPRDQRFSSLRGDELIVLEGLHPTEPRLALSLPGARAVARVYGPDGMHTPIALAADTLIIDGDAERCAVVWRSSHIIASEEAIAGMIVLAGLELPGQPIEWPAVPAPRQRMGTVILADPPPVAAPDNSSTVVIEPAPPPAAGRRGTVVIADAPVAPVATGRRGTMLLTDVTAEPAPPVDERNRTMVLEPVDLVGAHDADETKPTQVLPAAALLQGMTPSLVDDGEDLMETAFGDPGAPREPVAPFAIPAPGSSSGYRGPIPGAPWAPPTVSAAPPRPTSSWESTLDIAPDPGPEDPPTDAPTLKVKPTRPLPPLPEKKAPETPLPAAPAAEKPVEKSWSWRAPDPPAEPEAPKPAAKKPIPKVAVQKSLYGKFGGPPKK